MFGAYETQYGLPSGFLARTAQIESAFNPMARNPNSSAGGLFQFIDSTAQQYGLENRFDPAQATDAAARLARDNAAVLRRALGREPTAAELYLAHQQGGGGASKLLANPNARAVDVVGIDAVRLNGGDENMTAGQFASKWLNKFDMIEGGAGSDTLAGGLSILPNRPDRLEDNAMQPEKSGGLLGGLWDKTGLDEERRAMLAMALSGMSMRPNTGLQAAAQMKMKNASDRKTRNKTIDWLQSRGRDDLARAVASGALDGRSAAQLAMAPAKEPRVFPMGDRLVDETGRVIADFSAPQGQLSEEQVTQLGKVQDDSRRDLEPYEVARQGFEQIQAFAKGGSVDDYALTVAFAKLLDPGSVVRGEEQQAIAQAGAYGSAFKAAVENAFLGNGQLPPEVRKRIVELSADLYNKQAESGQATYQRYGDFAEEINLPRDRAYMAGEEPYFFEGQSQGGVVRPQARSGNITPQQAAQIARQRLQRAITSMTPQQKAQYDIMTDEKMQLQYLRGLGLL